MTRFAMLLVLLLAFVSTVAAEPSFKCLLVSIEKYELAPLDFADNDVAQFANILMQRYDCEARACVDSAALVGDSGADAAKRSIMGRIETWCKSIGSEDNALLYLAGHGVKDDGGKLYLAMINFDRKNFDSAAIPLEWIRGQFGKSRGKNKMLLIDTCFAGTAKSIDFEQAASDEVSGSFAELQNVVTIASCRGNEKSWLWGDAKHSLFTYWLIEAFKGHADHDGDMVVTCDEIVRYVQENVPRVSNSFMQQHPVVYNEAAGANFKLPLRAVSGKVTISQIAQPASPAESLPVPAAAPTTNPTDGHCDVWIATCRVGSSGGYTGNLFKFRGNDCYFPIVGYAVSSSC